MGQGQLAQCTVRSPNTTATHGLEGAMRAVDVISKADSYFAERCTVAPARGRDTLGACLRACNRQYA